MARAALLVAGVAALALVCAFAALPSHAAPPSRIVFAANGAPATGGEIYRVTAAGRRVDLSRSPARDVAPAVSPDGKKVAFLSTRSGHVAFYTVGIDGGHLRQISPLLSPFDLSDPFLDADIEWSPNGKTLAVELLDRTVARVFLLDADGGGWHAVSPADDDVLTPASWSPDGGLLTYAGERRHDVYVSSAAGVVRWHVRGSGAAWSARGRLVVQTSPLEASVYTARGRKLASFAAAWTAWSPNGNTLASLTLDGTFQTRAGGAGEPTLELDGLKPDPFGQDNLGWIGEQKVRYLTSAGWEGLEVATRIPFTLPRGFANGSSVASPDGLEAAAGIASGGAWTLQLSKLGGPTRSLARAAGCRGEDPFSGVEFAPRTRSVVYMSGCFDPPGDLYSVSPDGSDLERLTSTAADETDPSMSPDGRTIAYVENADFLTCPTCGNSIWLANIDGSDPRRLTKPSAGVDTSPPDDASPSFSPDGTQVMFERDGETSSDLYVVPAAGGAARDLGVEGYFPSWGPQRIAYVNDEFVEVTAGPGGSDPQPFAVNGRLVAGPTAWSTDSRLALLAGVDNLSTIVLSTGQRIQLPGLQLAAQAGGIAWSPDGTKLAFIVADSSGVADVYTVGADGTGLTRITHDLGATCGISWR